MGVGRVRGFVCVSYGVCTKEGTGVAGKLRTARMRGVGMVLVRSLVDVPYGVYTKE